MSERKLPDFKSMLAESEELVSHIDTHGMPSITRNITQLAAVAKRLARAPVDSAAESQAAMFFASEGVDIAKYARTLRNIDLTRTYESLELVSDLELDKFLDHQRQLLVSTAIEESSHLTATTFRQDYIKKMEDEWDEAKRELLEQLSHAGGTSRAHSSSMHDQGVMGRSFQDVNKTFDDAKRSQTDLSFTTTYGAKEIIDIRMARYARTVAELNHQRITGQPFMLIPAFKATALYIDQFNNTDPDPMQLSWELLRCIVHEHTDRPGQRGDALREKHFEQQYQSASRPLRLRLIDGARHFSELLFRQFILKEIRKHPKLAQHPQGGVPSLKTQVEQYLQIRSSEIRSWCEDRDRRGNFVWPLVYYAFRCGDLDVALEFAKESSFTEFIACLQLYRSNVKQGRYEKKLNEQQWQKLVQEYFSTAMRDPYKVVMYNLIGRCDAVPNINYRVVAPTLEDYLWLKLSMLWETGEQLPDWIGDVAVSGEQLLRQSSLQHLQQEILRYGADHYTSEGRYPLVYFRVLMMAQLFEQAIDWLVRGTAYFVEGVHLGIALDYYGLLRCSRVRQQDLLVNNTLDFPRIIWKYIEPFAPSNPVEAFHYLFLLCPTAVASSVDLEVLSSISKLLLRTRAYTELVGQVKEGFVDKSGAIYKYLPDSAHSIIKNAATEAETNGQYKDAVELYALAEEFNQVASVLLQRLSRLITSSVSDKERKEFHRMTEDFLRRMKTLPTTRRPSRLQTPRTPVYGGRASMADSVGGFLDDNLKTSLEVLLQLVHFFNEYHANQPGSLENCERIINSLDIIPWRGSVYDQQQQAARFQTLDMNIKRCLGDVAVAMMHILVHRYREMKQRLEQLSLRGYRARGSTEEEVIMQRAREHAQNIATFVGLKPEYFGRDIAAKIIPLQAALKEP